VLLAALRRLRWPARADWPIVLTVGAFQLTGYFSLANLGVQIVPAGRSGVLAYTAMLWLVPLSLLVGERVGWRALAGVALGSAGIVVLIDPTRFDWSNRAVVEGHAWLLLAGFSWAIAILHARRHRWRGTPLDRSAVADVGGQRSLLWLAGLVLEPRGYLDFGKSELWIALALHRHLCRPGRHLGRGLRRAGPATDHGLARHAGHAVARHRGVRDPDRRDDHPAAAARDRAGDRGHCHRDPRQEELTDENWGMMTKAERDAAYNNTDASKNSAELNAARIAASGAFRKAHPEHLDVRYGPEERNVWDLFPPRTPMRPAWSSSMAATGSGTAATSSRA
jgi:hypothetical protein